jgi:hypothetical protein
MMAAPLPLQTVPQSVYVIWALLLAFVVIFVVPVTVFLLYRLHRLAVSIERYFAEMAEAGVSIADNTSHIKALEDTIQVATTILSIAGNINNHSTTIKETLAARTAPATTNGQGGE